jgi:hypothetical protein
MRYKLLGALVVLAVAGTGSATLLDVYGTVSGTADVDSAIVFSEVQATNNSGGEYLLLKNQADVRVNVSNIKISDKESSDNLVSTNESDYAQSGQLILVVVENTEIISYESSEEFVKASTQDAGITGGLSDSGEALDAAISGIKVDEFDYEGGCDSSEAEKPGEGCVEPTFVVNSE